MLLKVEGNVILDVLHVLPYAIMYIKLVHAFLFFSSAFNLMIALVQIIIEF
jgi:hypothetical protein